MTDRTAFRLPGQRFNYLAERKCLLSLLAAYSRQWNPRNLEAPWYEPWTQIFADLVAEEVSLSVAPQTYLWYDLAYQGSQSHTAPSPHHFLSPEDEDFADAGNITLASIRTISVPSHRNRCRIPDLAITHKIPFLPPQSVSQCLHPTWGIRYLGFPLLAELKASGARCRNVRTSLSNAAMPMSLAREQVNKQALHLFKMYPHQDSVILLAITGFWWSYRIFLRETADHLTAVDEEEEDDVQVEEEEDPTLPDQDGIHIGLVEVPPALDEESIESLQQRLYGFSLSALPSHGIVEEHAKFHTVLPADQEELLVGPWSDYLLYGTASSNQVFSLILDRLRSVAHACRMGSMG